MLGAREEQQDAGYALSAPEASGGPLFSTEVTCGRKCKASTAGESASLFPIPESTPLHFL